MPYLKHFFFFDAVCVSNKTSKLTSIHFLEYYINYSWDKICVREKNVYNKVFFSFYQTLKHLLFNNSFREIII